MMLSGTKDLVEVKAEVLHALADALKVPETTIDLDSTFIDNGGHSLSALQSSSACKKKGIGLSVGQILQSSSIESLLDSAAPLDSNDEPGFANAVAELKATINTPDLSSSSSAVHTPSSLSTTASSSEPDQRTIPERQASTLFEDDSTDRLSNLTEIQLSLIHGSLKFPGTNIIYHTKAYDTHDLPMVRAAWQDVIAAEPIFRLRYDGYENTTTLSDDEELLRWNEVEVESAEQALAILDPFSRQDRDGHASDETENSIDLTPEFQVVTFPDTKKGRRISAVQWIVHHALVDGFSGMLLFDRVRKAISGEPSPPTQSFSQLRDALDLYRLLNKADGDLFWQGQQQTLEDANSALLLPEPAASTKELGNTYVTCNLDITDNDLVTAASKLGVTPATVYYAAWALTLALYADSDTVCFGAVFSGRDVPVPQIMETVGPLMNTLPFCISLSRDETAATFLSRIFDHLLTLSRFQWTTPENGFVRDFASVVAMQFDEHVDADTSAKPEWSMTRQTTDIPLSLVVGNDGQIDWVYSKARYNTKDIHRLADVYKNAFQALLQPTTSVKTCLHSMCTVEQQQTLRKFGNCNSGLTTRASITEDLVTLFETAATQNESAMALELRDEGMSYRDLDTAAGRVAATLRDQISDGDVVCVHADGSVSWIISIYGVLKAGGTYCPLDAALPDHLRKSMVESSGAKVCIVPGKQQAQTFESLGTVLLTVDDILQQPETSSVLPHRQSARPWQSAYLCFTSGSTGKPKGVLCSHEGLVAFQRDLEVRLFARPGRRVAQTMSVAFDGSIHELFSALSYGATLVLKDPSDPFGHLNRVDATILTPTAASTMQPEDYPLLKTVYLVGEQVPQRVADTWGANRSLYNMYGPTEATCGATIKRLLPGKPITIGPPNPTTRIYILNRRQQLLPPGVVGEIYLAGVQVSRGYIGLPDITQERFLEDSVCRGLGEFMYKTGDQGYWNEDGEVVCLGRNDRQIKLRGFRLDLGDLEVRMQRADPAVTAVAIAQKEDFLVAMVTPQNIDMTDFRKKVKKVLPPHAVPKHILPVEQFPKTKIGKLDYKAIATIATMIETNVDDDLKGQTEERVAAIWRSVLKLHRDDSVGASANFVELGGHSLLQLRLGLKLSREFGVKVPLPVIIESATLRDLAGKIDHLQNSDPPDFDRKVAPLGKLDLTPTEREWWVKYRLHASSSAFNVSYVCTLDPELVDSARLRSAWNAVLARHVILRSRYKVDKQGAPRRIAFDSPPQVQRLRKLDCWQEINRPFSLDRAAPVRIYMTQDRLVIVASHIVCDLTTMQILLDEVSDLYEGKTLSKLTPEYGMSPAWTTPAPPCHLKFWSQYLEGVPATASYLFDPPPRKDYRGTSEATLLPASTWKRMLSFARRRNVTLQHLAVAAVALALDAHKEADRIDVMVGLPHINRKSEEDLQAVGLYLEPLPVRVQFPPDALNNTGSRRSNLCDESFMETVQRSCQASFGHAVPWHDLLEQMDVVPQYPEHPLLDLVVTFHESNNEARIPGLKPHYYWAEGSKFKLMVEFNKISEEHCAVRLEYDTSCYEKAQIDIIYSRICKALEVIHSETKIEVMKGRMEAETGAAAQNSGGEVLGGRQDLLGRLWADI